MPTVSRLCLALCIALAGAATAQTAKSPRDAQRILSTKVPNYFIKAENLLQAAGQISSDFNLPLGIEWLGDRAAEKEINHEWHDSTVEQILRDVAAFDIEYQLEYSNGVAHFRNVDLTDSPRNPLNIRVPLFTSENSYTRDAVAQLSKQLSFLMYPRQEEQRLACGGSSATGAGELRTTLSVTGSTARDILDALLTRSDFAMWVVVFSRQQPNTGYLKTESLWGNKTDSFYPDLSLVNRYDDPATGTYRGDWKIGLRKP
jgi:hypothetical protein